MTIPSYFSFSLFLSLSSNCCWTLFKTLKNKSWPVTLTRPRLPSSNRGSSMNTFELKCCHRPSCLPSYLPFAARCEEVRRQAADWDVFNALINVTVSGSVPSLMWNRHFESVAHAVRKKEEEGGGEKRLMCWWRNDILRGGGGDLQMMGPTSVSTLLCPCRGVMRELKPLKEHHRVWECVYTTHPHTHVTPGSLNLK